MLPLFLLYSKKRDMAQIESPHFASCYILTIRCGVDPAMIKRPCNEFLRTDAPLESAAGLILELCRPVGQPVLAHTARAPGPADLQGSDNVISGIPGIDHVVDIIHSSSRIRGTVFDHLLHELFLLGNEFG